MTFHEVWFSKRFIPTFVRVILLPFSGLYWFGWNIYLLAYKIGLKKAIAPHPKVICVGNLVAGGSGKTPLTIAIAEYLRDLGYPVILGLSGYGAPHSEAARLAPDGELDAKDWGDEPSLIRELEPDLKLVVGRRRVLAAELAYNEDPASVLLMDDGFQHLPLKKQISIILEDSEKSNHFVFPAGPYREPRSELCRATLVLPNSDFTLQRIHTFVRGNSGASVQAGDCFVLCALGRPDKFIEDVRQHGFNVLGSKLMGDHDPLQDSNLFDGIPEGLSVMVTSKDWSKLKLRNDLGGYQWIVAKISVKIIDEARFKQWLKAALESHQQN